MQLGSFNSRRSKYLSQQEQLDRKISQVLLECHVKVRDEIAKHSVYNRPKNSS